MEGFVPKHLGFAHVSEDEIIQQHTRPVAQEIFSNIDSTSAILVLDGTYITSKKVETIRLVEDLTVYTSTVHF